MPTPQFSDAEISDFVRQVIDYIHAQRDHYLPLSSPLSAEQKAVLRPFFPQPAFSRKRASSCASAS